MNTLKTLAIAAIALGAISAHAVSPRPSTLNVCSGTLQTFDIYSPQLGRDVTVDVWLPEAYTPGKPHPVVYMHDGQMLFDAASTWNHQAWEVDSVATALIEAGEIPAPIVIGPYNVPETRIADYMPTEVIEMIQFPAAKAALAQWMPDGARGAAYVDFLADTLKPAIDSLYSTNAAVEATVTMGSSMGGLISLYALCRRPDTFGSAGCLSTHLTGTVGENETFPSALAGYLVTHIPADGRHRIYLDNGDQDIDIPYLPYFPRVASLFAEAGYGDDRLQTYFDPGKGHNERAWAARLHLPLRFLLRGNE